MLFLVFVAVIIVVLLKKQIPTMGPHSWMCVCVCVGGGGGGRGGGGREKGREEMVCVCVGGGGAVAGGLLNMDVLTLPWALPFCV